MNTQSTIALPTLILLLFAGANTSADDPTPARWPEQFHALLYMNLSSGRLQLSDLWYDWRRGLNLNLMQKQLGPLLHDVEWNNGTSFYFTVAGEGSGGAGEGGCRTMEFGVGIPRPDFLEGSTYLGLRRTDGFLCHLWEKVDFIWYYEDVASRRPVRWDFYDGISTHVMTFEVEAVLEDPKWWQAPPSCFGEGGSSSSNGGRDKNLQEDGHGKAVASKLGLKHSIRRLISTY